MLELRGVRIYPGWLSREQQVALAEDVAHVLDKAPLVQPVTPRGSKMSVRMSASGRYGWITDRTGYRYETTHPDGQSWPDIPESVRSVWSALCPTAWEPESA